MPSPASRSVFLSWAGKKSYSVASALRDWLSCFSDAFAPWMSSDLTAGQRWSAVLAERLASTDTGILCVTPDNLDSPWLNFEAGAISRSVSLSQVIPYAIGIDPSEIPYPIGQFQAVRATRAGTLALLKGLSATMPQPVKIDNKLFSAAWPLLERAIAVDPADVAATESALGEIQRLLEALRSLKLVDVKVSPNEIQIGESIEIEYVVESESQGLPVWLGAAFRVSEGKWRYNTAEDLEIRLRSGIQSHSRRLTAQPESTPGEYAVNAELWFGPKSDSDNSFPLQVQWPTKYKVKIRAR